MGCQGICTFLCDFELCHYSLSCAHYDQNITCKSVALSTDRFGTAQLTTGPSEPHDHLNHLTTRHRIHSITGPSEPQHHLNHLTTCHQIHLTTGPWEPQDNLNHLTTRPSNPLNNWPSKPINLILDFKPIIGTHSLPTPAALKCWGVQGRVLDAHGASGAGPFPISLFMKFYSNNNSIYNSITFYWWQGDVAPIKRIYCDNCWTCRSYL